MFWLLIALLLLLALAVLGATLLSLWRRVKVLSRHVAAAGETVEQVVGMVDSAGTTRALGAAPCPTCGAPPRGVDSRPPGVPVRAR